MPDSDPVAPRRSTRLRSSAAAAAAQQLPAAEKTGTKRPRNDGAGEAMTKKRRRTSAASPMAAAPAMTAKPSDLSAGDSETAGATRRSSRRTLKEALHSHSTTVLPLRTRTRSSQAPQQAPTPAIVYHPKSAKRGPSPPPSPQRFRRTSNSDVSVVIIDGAAEGSTAQAAASENASWKGRGPAAPSGKDVLIKTKRAGAAKSAKGKKPAKNGLPARGCSPAPPPSSSRKRSIAAVLGQTSTVQRTSSRLREKQSSEQQEQASTCFIDPSSTQRPVKKRRRKCAGTTLELDDLKQYKARLDDSNLFTTPLSPVSSLTPSDTGGDIDTFDSAFKDVETPNTTDTSDVTPSMDQDTDLNSNTNTTTDRLTSTEPSLTEKGPAPHTPSISSPARPKSPHAGVTHDSIRPPIPRPDGTDDALSLAPCSPKPIHPTASALPSSVIERPRSPTPFPTQSPAPSHASSSTPRLRKAGNAPQSQLRQQHRPAVSSPLNPHHQLSEHQDLQDPFPSHTPSELPHDHEQSQNFMSDQQHQFSHPSSLIRPSNEVELHPQTPLDRLDMARQRAWKIGNLRGSVICPRTGVIFGSAFGSPFDTQLEQNMDVETEMNAMKLPELLDFDRSGCGIQVQDEKESKDARPDDAQQDGHRESASPHQARIVTAADASKPTDMDYPMLTIAIPDATPDDMAEMRISQTRPCLAKRPAHAPPPTPIFRPPREYYKRNFYDITEVVLDADAEMEDQTAEAAKGSYFLLKPLKAAGAQLFKRAWSLKMGEMVKPLLRSQNTQPGGNTSSTQGLISVSSTSSFSSTYSYEQYEYPSDDEDDEDEDDDDDGEADADDDTKNECDEFEIEEWELESSDDEHQSALSRSGTNSPTSPVSPVAPSDAVTHIPALSQAAAEVAPSPSTNVPAESSEDDVSFLPPASPSPSPEPPASFDPSTGPHVDTLQCQPFSAPSSFTSTPPPPSTAPHPAPTQPLPSPRLQSRELKDSAGLDESANIFLRGTPVDRARTRQWFFGIITPDHEHVLCSRSMWGDGTMTQQMQMFSQPANTPQDQRFQPWTGDGMQQQQQQQNWSDVSGFGSSSSGGNDAAASSQQQNFFWPPPGVPDSSAASTSGQMGVGWNSVDMDLERFFASLSGGAGITADSGQAANNAVENGVADQLSAAGFLMQHQHQQHLHQQAQDAHPQQPLDMQSRQQQQQSLQQHLQPQQHVEPSFDWNSISVHVSLSGSNSDMSCVNFGGGCDPSSSGMASSNSNTSTLSFALG